ncbi:hypothetical protein PV10_04055 [Exophiala mesophila]|uniref:Enoyl reductase (ER) domain-containing protein n=1 Tax=Exophiala mesophila TaxID=212818 RepID=A0A0D1ZG05_EXOME|nr:uncharacterized protein PV10_04055 [Exophiala mesophila]KIV92789.1 hypothetical protein PV10_04055 [Exophiala mesophila]
MASTFQSVVLSKRPEEHIVLGETFSVVDNPALSPDDLKDGEVIFQTKYISVDPGMRDWLNEPGSYMAPVAIGEVMRGFSAGVISASKHPKFPVGSYATGLVGWTEFKIVPGGTLVDPEIPEGGRLADALSLLGFTSLTAYYGFEKAARVKPGDLVVISGAGGATGSVAGQIAKIKGARVLGLTGSDEKVKWLKGIGFDDALNYKAPGFAESFKAATSGGFDIFWDNVGGEILELALDNAKVGGQIILCGGVSQVNTTTPKGPKNYMNIGYKRLRVQGFLVFDYPDENPQAYAQLRDWYKEGKLQAKETIIPGGVKQAEKTLRDIYNGVNTGKLLVEI